MWWLFRKKQRSDLPQAVCRCSRFAKMQTEERALWHGVSYPVRPARKGEVLCPGDRVFVVAMVDTIVLLVQVCED